MSGAIALWFAAAGTSLAVVAAALPGDLPLQAARPIIWMAVVAALIVGARRNRPKRAWAWYLLAGSIFYLTAGEVLLSHILVRSDLADPSGSTHDVAELIAASGHTVAILLAAGGLLALLSAGRRLRLAGVIDLAIFVSVLTLMLWELHVEGRVEAGLPLSSGLADLTTMVVMLGLLAFIGRLAVVTARHVISTRYLFAAVLCVLVGSPAQTVLDSDRFDRAILLTSLILIGAAALHPSMRAFSDPSLRPPAARRKLSTTWRILLLGLAITAESVGRTFEGSFAAVDDDYFWLAVGWLLDLLVLSRVALLLRERRRTQQNLVAREARFRSLVQNGSDVVMVVDRDGVLSYVSPAIKKLTGRDSADYLGSSVEMLVHPEDRWEIRPALIPTAGTANGVRRREFRLAEEPHGRTVSVEARVTDLLDDPAVQGVVLNLTDMTWRREASLQLLAQSSQQAAVTLLAQRALGGGDVAALMSEATELVTDTLGIDLSAAWELRDGGESIVLRAMSGASEKIVGALHESPVAAPSALWHGEATDAGGERPACWTDPVVIADLRERPDLPLPTLLTTCGLRSLASVVISGPDRPAGFLVGYAKRTSAFSPNEVNFLQSVAGVLAIALERSRAEAESTQAQKLEAVGRLAAGIAHEINTPVQFVGDNLHFLQASFSELLDAVDAKAVTTPSAPGGGDVEYLRAEVPVAISQALEGVDRIATIVRAMKAFGHPDQAEQAVVDLNEALRNTLVVVRNEVKYVADVETDFGDLPPVRCYLGDINQVFLNLFVNAAHAITDKARAEGTEGTGAARGRITVTTRPEGRDVVVVVRDTGSGIPPAIVSKIFEPFFTTKEVGRGTGQGLALAKAVVDKHRGQIRFDSSSQGTAFTIRLPVEGLPATGVAAVPPQRQSEESPSEQSADQTIEVAQP